MNENSSRVHRAFTFISYIAGMKRLISSLAALLVTLTSTMRGAERPLAIDREQSRVEVLVKATVDSFTARLVNYHAAVTVDPKAARVTAATVSFRFEDVRTGKDKRDKEMHAWQDTATYPEGRFTLVALEPAAGDGGPVAGNGHLTARGTLVFHGATRELSFPVAVTTDRALYAIDGEAPIDTREFQLPVIRKFGILKVDPHVVVRFHLQGTVAP